MPSKTKNFAMAKKLFKANAGQLPPDNTRPPEDRHRHQQDAPAVLTTDFFGFDTSDNHYGLQGSGRSRRWAMRCWDFSPAARPTHQPMPHWVAVRNVSDPQIKAEGTLKDQAQVAAQIYKGFGRWSSVCSAIVCWALIAA